MISLPLHHIDAFVTDSPFSGSGAAIVPLEAWIDTALMQEIAAENNLSETAFLVPEGENYRIRWFTPSTEIDLCGHATLASAFYLFEKQKADQTLLFHSVSGDLPVRQSGEMLTLDFPSRPATTIDDTIDHNAVALGFGYRPTQFLRSQRDWLLVFDSPDSIQKLQPNHADLARFRGQGFIATAKATNGYDFVFRYFAPALGLNEDPATGSVQSTLVPYWAQILGKQTLRAQQSSARGAEFHLQLNARGDRVYIGGRCRFYLEGTLHV